MRAGPLQALRPPARSRTSVRQGALLALPSAVSELFSDHATYARSQASSRRRRGPIIEAARLALNVRRSARRFVRSPVASTDASASRRRSASADAHPPALSRTSAVPGAAHRVAGRDERVGRPPRRSPSAYPTDIVLDPRRRDRHPLLSVDDLRRTIGVARRHVLRELRCAHPQQRGATDSTQCAT